MVRCGFPILTGLLLMSCTASQTNRSVHAAQLNQLKTESAPARDAEEEYAIAKLETSSKTQSQAKSKGGRVESDDLAARFAEQAKDIRYVDPVTPQGQSARGLYITGPYVKHFGVHGVIREVKQMKLDAVVIDLKDDRGRVTFKTQTEEFKPSSQNLLGDVHEMVKKLKASGIYVIGRVVCFNDNQLAARDPSRAIHESRPSKAKHSKVWTSWGTATRWLDPYNKRNHTLLVSFVREVASFGFDEIQLDYIRFPVDAGTEYAVYPAQQSIPRRFVLLEFLRQVDEAISIPLSADVFGLTAFREGDPTGLGQSLTDWTAHVEIFSPMLYLNSMKSWGRAGGFKPAMNPEKNNRAYVLVAAGVQTLRNRVGPVPVIRPFLQAFKPGADHWDPSFITEQVQASRDGHGDGFLFWHPGAHYGMVHSAMRGSASGIGSFRMEERQEARKTRWARAEKVRLNPKTASVAKVARP